MPVKIRLMRMGATKRPFYRVVAVDERKKRTGGYLELLGTYNPITQPKEINLNQERIDVWIKQGAQMSDGFLRIIGKAPQKQPRKAKKEKAEKAPAAAEVPKEEISSDGASTENAEVTEQTPEAVEVAPVETVEEPTPEEAPTEETTQAPVEEAASEEVAETPAEVTDEEAKA